MQPGNAVLISQEALKQAKAAARGYEEARREYHKQRQLILNSSGGSLPGEGHSGNRWSGTRATETKAERLESLERAYWVREMHAVERARDRIGAGMPGEMREALKKAIMINISSGKKYPFERLYVVGVSRRTFYRHRAAFLEDIAAEISVFSKKRLPFAGGKDI